VTYSLMTDTAGCSRSSPAPSTALECAWAFAGRVWGTYAYRLCAGPDSARGWASHDHGAARPQSINEGIADVFAPFGPCTARSALSGSASAHPDREFFQSIDARALVGNTPEFQARVGRVGERGRSMPRPPTGGAHGRDRSATAVVVPGLATRASGAGVVLLDGDGGLVR